jgi:hypothetical protein
MKSRRIQSSAGPTAIMPKDEAPAESRGRNNAPVARAPSPDRHDARGVGC